MAENPHRRSQEFDLSWGGGTLKAEGPKFESEGREQVRGSWRGGRELAPPHQLRDLGERRKLPQPGPGVWGRAPEKFAFWTL